MLCEFLFAVDLVLTHYHLLCMQKPARTVLPNLFNIRANPPSPKVSVGTEVLDLVNFHASLNASSHMSGDTNIAGDNIDWDITVDSSQIDWDIGTLEETDDTNNELASYEIVNASDVGPGSSSDDVAKSEQALLKEEESMAQEVPLSDICWDITVGNPQIELIEEDGLPSAVSEPHASMLNTLVETQGNPDERSPFLETEYRSKILDDLFEVRWQFHIVGHVLDIAI